jgi:polyhydroxyalkanoate synthesis regulator phasin
MADKKPASRKAKKAKAGSGAGRKTTARKPAAGKTATRKKVGPPPRKTAPRGSARRASPLDKSVEHFRQSLERSVTLSRERLQEVVDDAVKRGRITRGDAEKLLSDLLNRGRKQTDSLLGELERLVKQARQEVGGRTEPVRKQATQAARRARKKLS